MKHFKVIIRLNTETEPVYGLRPAVTVFGTFANFTRTERDAHLFDHEQHAAREGARATGMGRRGTYEVIEVERPCTINLSKSEVAEDDGTFAETTRPISSIFSK
jgi:hypothetical protein